MLIVDIDKDDNLTAFVECPPYNWKIIEYYWDNKLKHRTINDRKNDDGVKVIPIFTLNVKNEKDKHILKAIIILDNQEKIELTQDFSFNYVIIKRNEY